MPSNAVIDELVSRWAEARSRGEETSVEALCRDHPELIEPVGRIIAQRQSDPFGTTASDSSDSLTDPPPSTEISDTATFSGTMEWHDGLRPAQEAGEIGRLGPFRVIKPLGAGGEGMVYQAIDIHLGRSVALKVMRGLRADSDHARARFLREARIAAALEHDHIVAIYQVGEDNGVLYLAMPLLHGLTLRDRLRLSSPLALAEILRIGREIAEGLAAAHELGLIHLDVKPGNVWLEEGSGRVKILDFGLARVANDGLQVTEHGIAVGTPAFMAPEQARGGEELDRRSDLFSLGGILYRMVTGELPFPAEHTTAMLLSLISDDPIPPRQLNPATPPALEALILGLLAKDPGARPRSARLVVEAIRALEQAELGATRSPLDLGVQVVENESTGPGQRPRPVSSRRFPVVPAAALAMLLGIAVGIALRPWLIDAPGDQAVRSLIPPRITPPVADPPLTQTPPQPGSAPAQKGAVEPWPTRPPAHPRLPGLIPAPQLLAGMGRWQVETRSPRDAVLALSWSPDRKRLACAAGEKVVRIYEAESLKLVALLAGHTKPVFSVEWCPDGSSLASGSSDGTVRLWTASGAPVRVLQGHSGTIWCVRWSHDGSRLASASNDKSVRVWNAAGATELVLEHPAAVVAVAWSPDGKHLVSGSANQPQIWNIDGRPGPLLKGHTENIHAVSWSPDGTRIASAGDDRTVRLWNADGTPGVVLSDHDKIVRAVAWSPDGQRLATAGGDAKVRLWWADGTPGPVLSGLTRTVDSVAWSPDSQRLAAGSSAAELRIWDAGGLPGPSLTPLRTSSAVAFSPDRTKIVSASSSSPYLLLWGPDDVPGRVLKGRSRQVRSLAWSPDGLRIAATEAEATVQLWHADGTRGPTLSTHHDEVNSVAWSPDGNLLATASDDATVRLWNADGRPGPVLKGHSRPVLTVAWSPDSRRLATAGDDGSVRFWRADGVMQKPPVETGSSVISLAWSPDGARLAVGNLGGALNRWGSDQPASPPRTIRATNADAIAWHPDSTRLAIAGPVSVLRLWDVDGLEGPALTTPLSAGDWREAGVNVAWTPRGDHLLAASRHGFVWAWNTRTLAPEWVAVQTSPISITVFSPEGRLLRSDPVALKNFVYMLEQPDHGIELLTHQEFEGRSASK